MSLLWLRIWFLVYQKTDTTPVCDISFLIY